MLKYLFLLWFWMTALQARVYHLDLPRPELSTFGLSEKQSDSMNVHTFSMSRLPPFDKMVLSWNGTRPEEGYFLFSVRCIIDGTWSTWTPYALWGRDIQKMCPSQGLLVDDICAIQNALATGLEVQVAALEGADLASMRTLHVTTKDSTRDSRLEMPKVLWSGSLNTVPPLSQMALNSPFAQRICSPTSIAAVLSSLSQGRFFDPLEIAQRAFDPELDLFGVWPLNIAAAYAALGNPSFDIWVEWLDSIDPILHSLQYGLPVIISVRGDLPGAPFPYKQGHLLVITGIDAERFEFLCMDPAFDEDAKTHVRYPIPDLIRAWEARGRVAYMFRKKIRYRLH
jgi:hypothetical protein